MKNAVFFILARMESSAVFYLLRKSGKLHFYSLDKGCNRFIASKWRLR